MTGCGRVGRTVRPTGVLKRFEGVRTFPNPLEPVEPFEPVRTHSNLFEPDYHMNLNPTRATRGARIAVGRR
jgi:hypothetical protein